MKKIISTIVASILLLGMMSMTVFASTYYSVDFTKDYYNCIDSAFYMYYHPKEPTWNKCWASTEISVSNDMDAYVYVKNTGVSGEITIKDNDVIKNSYIKTEAAIVSDSYAKEVRYYAYRYLNGKYLNSWDYTIE